jgi:hypothetical protein
MTSAEAQEAVNGRVAESAVGRVGQRQLRNEPIAGVAPNARINGRIQNRIQSRIRNRLDRAYDPQANTITPFATADDAARTVGGSSRR